MRLTASKHRDRRHVLPSRFNIHWSLHSFFPVQSEIFSLNERIKINHVGTSFPPSLSLSLSLRRDVLFLSMKYKQTKRDV